MEESWTSWGKEQIWMDLDNGISKRNVVQFCRVPECHIASSPALLTCFSQISKWTELKSPRGVFERKGESLHRTCRWCRDDWQRAGDGEKAIERYQIWYVPSRCEITTFAISVFHTLHFNAFSFFNSIFFCIIRMKYSTQQNSTKMTTIFSASEIAKKFEWRLKPIIQTYDEIPIYAHRGIGNFWNYEKLEERMALEEEKGARKC